MKKNNIVLFGIAVLCACSVPKERQPLTGGQWGEIKNGSAEEVVSSEVLYWQAPPASKEVLHFYDATAHDGTRSLCISADGLANGYWNNRVNLKPWSKYRFKGWIKCENVVAEPQGGAGFRLQGVEVQLPDFTRGEWNVVKGYKHAYASPEDEAAAMEKAKAYTAKLKEQGAKEWVK